MNQQNNFTSLKVSKPSVILRSLISFVLGAAVVGFIYINMQTSKPKTVNTKASEKLHTCITEITNPFSAHASIIENNKPIQIDSNDPISTSSVVLEWQPVAKATSYYIALSDDPESQKGAIDPAVVGKKVNSVSYQFDDLLPGKTYYFLIRSVNEKGMVALTYPTLGNCDYLVGALPLLEIKTNNK